jgi:hypothetical protein
VFILSLCQKNKGDAFEDEDEDEDYIICKALFKHCDQELIERLKAHYGPKYIDIYNYMS